MMAKDKSKKEQLPVGEKQKRNKADFPDGPQNIRSRELNEKELEGVSGGATITKHELIKLQKK